MTLDPYTDLAAQEQGSPSPLNHYPEYLRRRNKLAVVNITPDRYRITHLFWSMENLAPVYKHLVAQFPWNCTASSPHGIIA